MLTLRRYTRPSASDFDDWKTEGWATKDLLPLLRKVSYANKPKISAIGQAYLEVAQKRGVPLAKDKQDLNTGHGCQRWAKWIDPATGFRQDAAHRYIHPLSGNKHLHIMTATKVIRVVFNGTTATGVEVVADKDTEEGADQTPRIIKARKLVVVSAGAVGSPIVLQRSGVGEAERLTKVGIEIVSDLPVGSTYEDHNLVLTPYHVADDTETIDPIMNKDPAFLEQARADFTHGKGALATNWIDCGSKLRPTPKELEDIGPAFAPVWKSYFEPNPDKPVMLQTVIEGWLGPREMLPYRDARTILVANYTGYVSWIRLSWNSYVTYLTCSRYPEDMCILRRQIHMPTPTLRLDSLMNKLTWTFKFGPINKLGKFTQEPASYPLTPFDSEIVRRLPQYRGEFEAVHPKFPKGSAAGCVKLDGPPDADNVEDIVYTPEDNKAIETYLRQFIETTWHSVGTVLMKPKEQGGCIDARLNVYGTQNLKVADLSIIPGNVGSNTNSTALVIGEKAAVIIAEDLGLKIEISEESQHGPTHWGNRISSMSPPDTT
ncbi:alcohol oxidase [Rhizoctonia solani AG-1 IA]|uniref:Alcohol oxidase n=1 Tax=Thanatephorus cucumeris (strain AG1-IA) TaxID=983506 RepID=L8X0Q4_THACA|nr:alcohol oxidase [Rhizoctonia solani AG-1 IA]